MHTQSSNTKPFAEGVITKQQFADILELAQEGAQQRADNLGKVGHTPSEVMVDEFSALNKAQALLKSIGKSQEVSALIDPRAWQPMSSAPKDRPILAWCEHEADPPYVEGPDGQKRLSLYAAHAEGLSHAPTGMHILVWGGAYDESTWEYPNGAYLPDWWFVEGSEYEVAANPICWMPAPEMPTTQQRDSFIAELLAQEQP